MEDTKKEKMPTPLQEENAGLRARLEEVETLNQALEAAVESQAAEIESLKAQLATPAKSGRPVSLAPKEFELDGKTYPFPAPAFFLEGFGRVTTEAALEKPEILRRLVDIGAGKID